MEQHYFSLFSLMLFSALIGTTFSYQDGFLSLTCGGTTSYVDSSNISWTPDGYYVTIGNMTTVVFPEGTSSTSLPVRFFPDSAGRKCYRLPIQNTSSLVLVRTRFVYKNYDGLGKPPVFSVSLGTLMTTTVNLAHTDPWIEEFIWPANKDILPLCFHSIPNGGFPVVSSLELRPLPPGAYVSAFGDSNDKLLRKSYRINCGYNDGPLRYPLDPYDRIWDADEDFSPYHVSAGFDVESNFSLSNIKESPPVAVLQTARVLARWNNLVYRLPLDNQGDYHVVLYFAGILPVSPSFDVIINGEVVQSNYTVMQWEANSLFFTVKGIRTLNITLKTISYYPLVNALEVYEILDIPLEASSTTVSALQVIQHSTGLDLGWQDDPCSPKPWNHIGCDGNLVTSLKLFDVALRTISPTFGDLLDLKALDLHNTSLAGEIQNLGGLQHLEKLNLSFNQITSFGSELEDLINIQVLDLHNNSLEGAVPESLGELRDLHLLNLENNKLQGPLPQSLNRESLEVRTSGNLCLSFSLTCNGLSRNPSLETPQVTIFTPRKRKNHSHLAILLGAVGGAVLALFVISFSALLYLKRKRAEKTYTQRHAIDMQSWNSARVFTYKEIKATTNNFKEAIGRGSFGCVYIGKLPGGKLVAVKVRFDKTQLGADSFINEVSLLSQIRHQNLVSLEGFCCESKQQILVYEYLPGGSLADNLYGANSKKLTLSWVRRLKIAVDAAKGLDYLHNGNDLRIIHRDVKSSNILLDMEMNAKVSDFGLSKQVTQSDASHVTTVVKGTAGYLDPEYYSTQQLTEKSDVYSFGVVLLELICGREPLTHTGTPDSFNLVLWAKPYLQANAFEIVDENIKGSFDAESMRRAALIACRAVERDAMRRPTISEVLAELKEAYSLQIAYLASSGLVN
ncbi:probable LRR receptor-like serine/threonine-protein kinase At5g48740 [Sesamum indicum]|uniref:non-specific serine/threonine protein kinase n=1 Tax=Sesamum indicum TaxID=4182 RepID=A0A6I9TTD0_SESIN|nr:probable LRR receptor-like serine/threonine-protein kinase At5g48740 [Sesamum indicum]XP_011089096.1 probable LRR receptor-like serine/threonine-protein kinase At5g48740 [Sesamum indicum]